MSFGEFYASTYDRLYSEKPYALEASFVLDRLRRSGIPISDVLEFGCGTGRHAVELAKQGVAIEGIDISPSMVAIAKERVETLSGDIRSRLSFSVGDARSMRLERVFDAAIFLFHVMSYMPDHNSLVAALRTARSHLRAGAPLLFDFWYGPAVLHEPPRERLRTLVDELRNVEIERITKPDWRPETNSVNIRFEVTEKDLRTGSKSTATEQHEMRYYFDDDIRQALLATNFSLVEIGEWLTGVAPSSQSFGVYALALAV
jgi:SAM-dependent methyltransferase